jgi:hypothetical protein
MSLEIIRTKTRTIVECPLKPSNERFGGWNPGAIYPFFPGMLFLPKDFPKKDILALRPGYKAEALREANHSLSLWKRKKGYEAKIVTRSDCYEVMWRKK